MSKEQKAKNSGKVFQNGLDRPGNNEWNEYWADRQDNDVTDDGRSSSQRDYARIVHSSAFRRLQAKTQVLGLGDSDFYRTRLTHSLEVSQIGEGITRELNDSGQVSEDVKKVLPDSEQIRAICLSHDLGHPPFGHGGERALNKMMLDYGGFEGNAQSLRIMASLPSYHRKYGMNLSRRTLLGVLKYPAPHDQVVNDKVYPEKKNYHKVSGKKFRPPKCYFEAEAKAVGWISERLKNDWGKFEKVSKEDSNKHGKTKHMSLDARIMEMADDIAYGTHDLEDAIALRLVTESDLRGIVTEKILEPFLNFPPRASRESYDSFVNRLFHDSSYVRKRAIGNLVGFFVRTVEVDDVDEFENPIFRTQVRFEEENKLVLHKLQKVVRKKVISSRTVQQLEFKGKKIITELFEAFSADPKNLLPRKQARIYRNKQQKKEKMRVICDYIAGMTDDYAIRRYQQMFVPGVGSVFDYLG